ncbi:hypothetical protein N6M78_02810, partial [Treponema pallidum]
GVPLCVEALIFSCTGCILLLLSRDEFAYKALRSIRFCR